MIASQAMRRSFMLLKLVLFVSPLLSFNVVRCFSTTTNDPDHNSFEFGYPLITQDPR